MGKNDTIDDNGNGFKEAGENDTKAVANGATVTVNVLRTAAAGPDTKIKAFFSTVNMNTPFDILFKAGVGAGQSDVATGVESNRICVDLRNETGRDARDVRFMLTDAGGTPLNNVKIVEIFVDGPNDAQVDDDNNGKHDDPVSPTLPAPGGASSEIRVTWNPATPVANNASRRSSTSRSTTNCRLVRRSRRIGRVSARRIATST